MLGIDLTKISRFESPKETFIKKVLHPEEIKKYRISNNKPNFLAKRWAVKEALFKADNNLFHFNQIELKDDGRVVRYDGYEISTTKEDDYYIAIVMKEK